MAPISSSHVQPVPTKPAHKNADSSEYTLAPAQRLFLETAETVQQEDSRLFEYFMGSFCDANASLHSFTFGFDRSHIVPPDLALALDNIEKCGSTKDSGENELERGYLVFQHISKLFSTIKWGAYTTCIQFTLNDDGSVGLEFTADEVDNIKFPVVSALESTLCAQANHDHITFEYHLGGTEWLVRFEDECYLYQEILNPQEKLVWEARLQQSREQPEHPFDQCLRFLVVDRTSTVPEQEQAAAALVIACEPNFSGYSLCLIHILPYM
ncbi:hypothetical protein F4604DRAFT_1918618 [Suillus subluteus]|nr:hypothetical protein F4604DRAFT_1918618 [Suillus subluteus]